ncbi:HesB/IscA family protein [Ornithinimicrobium cavernae]|uniref:HesB/IscA family protein n=1 Tax=Ornithinimicrobium cavernae TaxID=2666047 RepID=UPI0013797ED7|nr:iron-sulfur cluster assembly accessory protein [Ornithinimicrobium cavernae]
MTTTAPPPELVLPPFTVTRAAISQIEALGGSLRIDAEDGGCSGTTYEFAAHGRVRADAETLETDARYGCPGAWLLVGERAAGVLPGATLDYSARLRPPRFRVIRNPNTPDTCPCRRSFGAPWPGPGQPTCRSYDPMPWDSEDDSPRHPRRQTGSGGTDQP